jgi:hypothetical protein
LLNKLPQGIFVGIFPVHTLEYRHLDSQPLFLTGRYMT